MATIWQTLSFVKFLFDNMLKMKDSRENEKQNLIKGGYLVFTIHSLYGNLDNSGNTDN